MRSVRAMMLVCAMAGTFAYYGSQGYGLKPSSGEVAVTGEVPVVAHRHLLNTTIPVVEEAADPMYPDELFSKKELKAGGIFLHALGVLYMFVALAIVCDECFVPALEVLVEMYDISDDVAGATFMAAGGSAPELFTSLIGVFIAKSNVGFGTIIGSAVFNVLFVIGMCAYFSSGLLELTWWPLARDCSFYTFDLCMLYVFFIDQKISWWEALLLISFYLMYVSFMFFNESAERFVKGLLGIKVAPASDEEALAADAGAAPAEPERKEGTWTTESAPEEASGAKTTQMAPRQSEPGTKKAYIEVRRSVYASTLDMMLHNVDAKGKGPDSGTDKRFQRAVQIEANKSMQEKNKEEDKKEAEAEKEEEEEEGDGIDLSWPDTLSGQINYVLSAPLLYLLAYSFMPVNCRKEEKKHLWPAQFILSILFIGAFSYLMVWWATTIGSTVGMPDEVMGYTFLAAGTSVPDLMSSVIVAKQGLGDMAVSSSIGSNIFDITLGLPLPWLIWTLANKRPIDVISNSLEFSLVLLIIMLVAIVGVIAASGWKMTKPLGAAMFTLYAIFLTLVLLQNYGKLPGF